MRNLKSAEMVKVLKGLSQTDDKQMEQRKEEIRKILEAAALRIENLTFKAESQLADDTWISISEANEQQEYVINRLSKMPVENDGDLIFQMQCTASMYKMMEAINKQKLMNEEDKSENRNINKN